MYTVSKMTVNKRLRIFFKKNVWEKVVVGKALPTTVHLLKNSQFCTFCHFLSNNYFEIKLVLSISGIHFDTGFRFERGEVT